jgi:MAP/microtubule affinity-regulating kinase
MHSRFTDLIPILQLKYNIYPIQRIRLFNNEGVEIFEEDLKFVKHNVCLFVSLGEEFDSQSSLSDFEILQNLG